jgi:hypothetical protein
MPTELHCPGCGAEVEIPLPAQSFGQLVSAYDASVPPDEVATLVLEQILPPTVAAFFHGAVTEVARNRQRRKTRQGEKTLLTVSRDWDRDVAARKAVLMLPMSLGDGTRVTWGEATWAQWEQRDRLLAHIEERVTRGVREGRAVVRWALACRELNPEASCLNEITVMLTPPGAPQDEEPGGFEAIESAPLPPIVLPAPHRPLREVLLTSKMR